MSVAFVPDWLRGKAQVNQETIQRVSANAGKEKVFLSRELEGLRVREEGGIPAEMCVPRVLTVRSRRELETKSAKTPGRAAQHWSCATLSRLVNVLMSGGTDPFSDLSAPGGE